MSFRNDCVTQLQNDGVGTLNVNIFTSSKASIPMLPSGAATLQLLDTGGTSPDQTQNSVIRPAYLQPSIQLTARADSYEVAWNMAQSAFDSLAKVRNAFIGSSWYLWIKPLQSEPLDGGADDRKQAQCKFNVICKYNRRP